MKEEGIIQLVLFILGAGGLVYLLTGVAASTRWLMDEVKLRSNHTRPTSRAGGIILTLIVSAFLVGAIILGWSVPAAFVLVALITALFGFLDDISEIPARMKTAALLVLSGFAAVYSGPVPFFPLPVGGEFILPVSAGYLLSTLFLFGFINAFNFMDGLNGMAGGAGLIGLSLLMVLMTSEAAGLILLFALTAAALYGFVVRNLLKGGIFLGDAGSLGLAMLLGSGALHLSQSRPASIFIFALAFIPFLLDVVITFARRARRGEPVFEAHKEHIYQRLRVAGWSHQAISAAYSVMILAGSLIAYLFEQKMDGQGLWIAGVLMTLLTMLVWKLMFSAAQKPVGLKSAGQSS